MRRVRCPLKPDSMTATPIGTPTAVPTWTAEEYRCCAKSSVTVTLTPDQLRMAQWNLVPGSWEHGLYFEAARALTEQRFSLLKSPHITGIANLTWGPRREPMIKIILRWPSRPPTSASRPDSTPTQSASNLPTFDGGNWLPISVTSPFGFRREPDRSTSRPGGSDP